ncbi:MAG: hypothetical protein AAF732_17410 [Pseudomonadota bacterium]
MTLRDQIVLKLLETWSHLGAEEYDDGLILIGHRPVIAEFSYFHRVFPPITREDLNEPAKPARGRDASGTCRVLSHVSRAQPF